VAELGAVNLVGESIAALLRARRSLLQAEGRLDPVPPSADIAHVPLAKLVGTSPPTAGLSLTCFHVARSDHTLGRGSMSDPSRGAGLSLELTYLLACWSSTSVDEQALLSWAMLELDRYPILDQGQLLGGSTWERGEQVQIAPDDSDPDRLFRFWDSIKQKYRLSTLYKVRVVRIGYGPQTDAPPVAASRFEFAHGDPSLEPAL
jgi:hypothetical protein